MTKFENPSFSVYPGASKNYRDNYDNIFGKKKDKTSAWGPEQPDSLPKDMSDLPPARDAQPAPAEQLKPKKAAKKKAKNEKTKKKQKAKTK